jgi:hypothetical protein
MGIFSFYEGCESGVGGQEEVPVALGFRVQGAGCRV